MLPVKFAPGAMLPLSFTSLITTPSPAAKICPSLRALSAAPCAAFFLSVTEPGVDCAADVAAAAAIRALDWNVAEAMKLLNPGDGFTAVLNALAMAVFAALVALPPVDAAIAAEAAI